MSDRVEDLVARTIRFTGEILDSGSAPWRVAREGLLKIAARIERSDSGHPAIEALRRFIVETDARQGFVGPSH